MAVFLTIIGWTCFALAVLLGLALDLVGLFGNWIILGALASVWVATGFDHFGPWSLAVLTGLAFLGEVVEAVAAGLGAKKFGAGKGAMVAAVAGCLVGSVIGTPWFPIVGTLMGGCLGAFTVAVFYQYFTTERRTHEALRTGFGAALGMVAGLFAKFLIGLAMLMVAALAY